ncbi:hypothetical protein MHM83_10985 [Tenacibaculum sp. Mcav3-52]|uniref:hypothetical protein n=1 Tax=Tenacibaculum sp. Mcav3-52 TaxID=2917762 RepID=UPI001EF3B440|nr:hypothetical protein [Tenacibaculum sp. Mcav3-52]MCG7502397.1 hypothetical protein [Tenacibaculum sp. Mcav3-52]
MSILIQRKIICDSCKKDITNWKSDKLLKDLRVDFNVKFNKGKDYCESCVSKATEKTSDKENLDTWSQKTKYAQSIGYKSISDAISGMGKIEFNRGFKIWILM